LKIEPPKTGYGNIIVCKVACSSVIENNTPKNRVWQPFPYIRSFIVMKLKTVPQKKGITTTVPGLKELTLTKYRHPMKPVIAINACCKNISFLVE
jgi:hypothetical protein